MSTRSRIFGFLAAVTVLVACESRQDRISVSAQTSQYQTGSLDQILAPIALYPDSLLAQMLMSAGDPASVTKLHEWLKLNASLKGTQLQDEAVKAGFEPSFVALTLFPPVVATMAQQITWTTRLGEVFTADRSAVFNSIQKLRQQAQSVGTLKTNAQQEVQTKTTEAGQQVIVIEPANPQIIYVPQYNTQVVYTQPPTTTVVVKEDDDSGAAVAAGLIGFTAGIAIGASMNNNYYYGAYGWHGGGYMYNDAWDDYYDHREDAREDWQDHREDLNENRGDRAKNGQEQRTERTESRNENRPESSQRATQAQAQRASGQNATAQTQRPERTGSAEARGYSEGARSNAGTQRSGGGSDAFSGYSSGASQRSASSRGQSSRSSSSRSGGSRSGGGRRR
jgi:uncharacterized membrane protein YgcG